jgi:hypothetical protein
VTELSRLPILICPSAEAHEEDVVEYLQEPLADLFGDPLEIEGNFGAPLGRQVPSLRRTR